MGYCKASDQPCLARYHGLTAPFNKENATNPTHLMIRTLIPTFGFAVYALAATLNAGVVVTMQDSAPDKNVFLTVAPTANSLVTQWRHSGSENSGRRDVGQTFYVSQTLALKSFTFKLSGFGVDAPEANIVLSIYKFSDGTSYTPSDPNPYVATGILPVTLTAGKYLTFTLDEAATLTGGNYYGVVLSFPDFKSKRTVNLYSGGKSIAGPDYGNSLYYEYSEGDGGFIWKEANNAFQMYATTIPEPGMVHLILSAASFLLFWRVLSRKHA